MRELLGETRGVAVSDGHVAQQLVGHHPTLGVVRGKRASLQGERDGVNRMRTYAQTQVSFWLATVVPHLEDPGSDHQEGGHELGQSRRALVV